jgi:hypothetical protein
MNISRKQIINMIALGIGVLFSTTLWSDSHYIVIAMFAVFVSYCSFVIMMARDSNKQMSAALLEDTSHTRCLARIIWFRLPWVSSPFRVYPLEHLERTQLVLSETTSLELWLDKHSVSQCLPLY